MAAIAANWPPLSAFGKAWGTAEMFALARQANENPPKLHAFDAKGFRSDTVEFHPAYHGFMRESVAAGLHASTWTETGQRAAPAGRSLAQPRASTWRRKSRPGICVRSP